MLFSFQSLPFLCATRRDSVYFILFLEARHNFDTGLGYDVIVIGKMTDNPDLRSPSYDRLHRIAVPKKHPSRSGCFFGSFLCFSVSVLAAAETEGCAVQEAASSRDRVIPEFLCVAVTGEQGHASVRLNLVIAYAVKELFARLAGSSVPADQRPLFALADRERVL